MRALFENFQLGTSKFNINILCDSRESESIASKSDSDKSVKAPTRIALTFLEISTSANSRQSCMVYVPSNHFPFLQVATGLVLFDHLNGFLVAWGVVKSRWPVENRRGYRDVESQTVCCLYIGPIMTETYSNTQGWNIFKLSSLRQGSWIKQRRFLRGWAKITHLDQQLVGWN